MAIGDLTFSNSNITLQQDFLVSNNSDRTVTIREAYCSMAVKLPDDQYSTPCRLLENGRLPITITPGASHIISVELPFMSTESMGWALHQFRQVAPNQIATDFLAYILKNYGIDFAHNPVSENSRFISVRDQLKLDAAGQLDSLGSVTIGVGKLEDLHAPIGYYYLFKLDMTTTRDTVVESGMYIAELGMPF